MFNDSEGLFKQFGIFFISFQVYVAVRSLQLLDTC